MWCRFHSFAALVARKAHAQGGSHGQFSFCARFVVINQCPARRTTLAFQKTAKAHLIRAFRRGRCEVNPAHAVHPVVQPRLQCLLCFGA
eukprot:7203258-Pyramimonas_sp.AAC.1